MGMSYGTFSNVITCTSRMKCSIYVIRKLSGNRSCGVENQLRISKKDNLFDAIDHDVGITVLQSVPGQKFRSTFNINGWEVHGTELWMVWGSSGCGVKRCDSVLSIRRIWGACSGDIGESWLLMGGN